MNYKVSKGSIYEISAEQALQRTLEGESIEQQVAKLRNDIMVNITLASSDGKTRCSHRISNTQLATITPLTVYLKLLGYDVEERPDSNSSVTLVIGWSVAQHD